MGKVDWGVLAPAEVGQRPDGVSGHGQAVSIGQDGQQGRKDTLSQHEVTQVCRVASDVAKSPNGLEGFVDHSSQAFYKWRITLKWTFSGRV